MTRKTAAILTALLFIGSVFSASAAPVEKKKAMGKGSARPAFDVDDNTIGFSIGLGSVYSYTYLGYGTTYLPAFCAYYDHGIIGHVGPGTIGIGGTIGIQSSYVKYPNGEKATWTNFIIGARGTYHLTILKDKNNKFDPYGGVLVGIRSETFSNNGGSTDGYGGIYPTVGAFVGAKYNFAPNFGAFAELGYDVSFLRLGLHLNF